jgi:hypothetical protein
MKRRVSRKTWTGRRSERSAIVRLPVRARAVTLTGQP